MATQRGRAGSGRAGRHRRSGTPLIDRREHAPERPRRFPLPAPSPSALMGIAVLVLIGLGVIHLSGNGSAVPLEEHTEAAAEQTGDPDAAADPAQGPSDETASDSEQPAAGTAEGAEADEAPPGPSTESSGATDAGDGSDSGQPGTSELLVHVSGAVGDPGVVLLPAGSRVDDAVLAAGGATGEADLAAVNLARPLVDGEQIHVPVPGEEVPASGLPPAPGEKEDPQAAGEDPDHPGGGPVDLNTATPTQLEQLPGVGPAIAQRIVDHREKNGPFRTVDDLIEVSGIGPATLERIRDQAMVQP